MICVYNSTCFREVGQDHANEKLNRQNVPDSPTSDSCSGSLSGSAVSSMSSDSDGSPFIPRDREPGESIEPLEPVESKTETFAVCVPRPEEESDPPQEEVPIGLACRRPKRSAANVAGRKGGGSVADPEAEDAPNTRDLMARLKGWRTRRLINSWSSPRTQFVSPRRVVFLTREEAVRHARATCGGPAAGIDGETFGKIFDEVLSAACDAPGKVAVTPPESMGPGTVRVRLCVGEPNVLDLHFSRPAKKVVERRRRPPVPKAERVPTRQEEDEESDRLTLELNELLCDIRRTLEDAAEEDDFAYSPVDPAPPEMPRPTGPFLLPRSNQALTNIQNTLKTSARPCPASKRKKNPFGDWTRETCRLRDGPPPGKRPRPASLNLRGTSVSKTKTTTFYRDSESASERFEEVAGPDEVESPQEPLRSGALSPSDDLLLAAATFDFEDEVSHSKPTLDVADTQPPIHPSW